MRRSHGYLNNAYIHICMERVVSMAAREISRQFACRWKTLRYRKQQHLCRTFSPNLNHSLDIYNPVNPHSVYQSCLFHVFYILSTPKHFVSTSHGSRCPFSPMIQISTRSTSLMAICPLQRLTRTPNRSPSLKLSFQTTPLPLQADAGRRHKRHGRSHHDP